jgi:hypothetical protein
MCDVVLRKCAMSSKYRYGFVCKIKNNNLHLFLLILLSGDVATNPGPGTSTEHTSNEINAIYLNARSLKAFVPFNDDSSANVCKIPLLQELVHSGSYDIICICETWLNDSIISIEIYTYRYTIFIDLFVMFMSAPRYGKLSVGFQPITIRENSTMNNNLI